jgi:hypothetical protein
MYYLLAKVVGSAAEEPHLVAAVVETYIEAAAEDIVEFLEPHRHKIMQ